MYQDDSAPTSRDPASPPAIGERPPRGAPLPVVDSSALTDRQLGKIRYLRVSVTDRCNYRCAYCMPVEGWTLAPRAEVLRLEEIVEIVGILARLGVERVRLTGGEPLVRRGLLGLVRDLAALPGIREVAMTTNGHLLARDAAALRAAGLTDLNVSLDSLDAERFETVTRGGNLSAVVTGIDAAREVGFQPIKLNVVAIAGVNDAELPDLCAFAWERDLVPRFIELMPIGGLPFAAPEHVMPTAAILQQLLSRYQLVASAPVADGRPRGPAHYWRVTGGPFAGRHVGIISPLTDDGFCAACNRARLTSIGGFRPCLGNDNEVSLRDVLRSGASFAAIQATIESAVRGKLPAHRMNLPGFAPRDGMTGIGG